MAKRMETPNYIKNLLKPTANKTTSRKVWSIDLETVWLPFFTATNAMGDTAIPHDALGAPMRLAYNQDGSVKFSKTGKPVVKVAKDISDNVRLVRDNFILRDDGQNGDADEHALYLYVYGGGYGSSYSPAKTPDRGNHRGSGRGCAQNSGCGAGARRLGAGSGR